MQSLHALDFMLLQIKTNAFPKYATMNPTSATE